MLVNLKPKDNLTDYLIVAKKFLLRTESKGYIKDSVFLCLVFSLIEPFISGKYKSNFSGYDAGKRFIWGSDQDQKNAPFLAKFLFAQIVTSSS
jgi:hypothetical protein